MTDGWNQKTGTTDHTQAMRYAKSLQYAELVYVRRDCLLAVAANPTGRKAGHYTDLASYCGMELAKKC